MPFDGANFGLPSWILASENEDVLARFTEEKSTVCRRAARKDFPVNTMNEIVSRLAHDNRIRDFSTLRLLRDFIAVINVTSCEGIVVEPNYGSNNTQNDFMTRIYENIEPSEPMQIHHLLGLEKENWLVTDIEHAFRFTANIVFPNCASFNTAFRTVTVRDPAMHTDFCLVAQLWATNNMGGIIRRYKRSLAG